MKKRAPKYSYKEIKEYIESYKNLNYKLNMSEEEYLNAPMQKNGKRILNVTHEYLDSSWNIRMDHFNRDAETHLNNSGLSLGELIIKQILTFNHVAFKTQKRVYINNTLHKFDFYLEDYNLYIEYDGEQHYYDRKHWGKYSFQSRKNRDKEKDDYCLKNNCFLLRINYKVRTPNEIAIIIGNSINKKLFCPDNKYLGLIKNVAEFYTNHTLNETIEEYAIKKETVFKYHKQYYGKKKYENKSNKKKKIIAKNKNNLNSTIFNSITSASTELKINRGNILSCLNKKRKSAGGYVFNYYNEIGDGNE